MLRDVSSTNQMTRICMSVINPSKKICNSSLRDDMFLVTDL